MQRVLNGGSDVLVGMVGHGLSSFSARRLTTRRIISNPHDRRSRGRREKLVRRLVTARGESGDVSALEAEVNARVYRLFGLTPAEIALVEEAK